MITITFTKEQDDRSIIARMQAGDKITIVINDTTEIYSKTIQAGYDGKLNFSIQEKEVQP